jgi:hypothetical protein
MRSGFALKYKLESLGNDASDRYLSGEGTLNDVVTKVASENNLESEEIVRVAEAANKATFLNLFQTEEDKTFEFPLADSREVLSNLNKRASEKVSMEDLGAVLVDSRKDTSLQEILPSQMVEKVAAESQVPIQKEADDPRLQTSAQLLNEGWEKVQEVEKELRSQYLSSKFAAEEAVRTFTNRAGQEIVSSGSMGSINKLACFLAKARPEQAHTINLLFTKVAQDLHIEHHWKGNEQVEKVAAEVDCNLITEPLSIGTQPVEIINGDNPMIRELDTTVEQIKEVDKNGTRYYEVRDQVKYLRGKVYEYIDRENKVGV